MKILVFDTETSGLPPRMPGETWAKQEEYGKRLLSFPDFKKKDSAWSQHIDSWPHIIQLSYIFYDSDKPSRAKIVNKYIDIPEHVEISESSAKIHHITRESIAAADEVNRAEIYDALKEFMKYVKKADIIVAHNAQFDRKMIVAELLRLSEEYDIPEIEIMMNDAYFECSMEKTKPICQLKAKYEYVDKITGEPKFFYKIKSPKLTEAYQFFFGYEPNPEMLHDAIIDVIICLRVYCISLKQSFDICGTNKKITEYIMRISPVGYTCSQVASLPLNGTTPRANSRTGNTRSSSKSSKSSRSSSRSSRSSKSTTQRRRTSYTSSGQSSSSMVDLTATETKNN
jgi:DNA polymerase III epsilon subunit-like protein